MEDNLPENVGDFIREHMSKITSACSIDFLSWLLDRVPDSEIEIRYQLKKAINKKLSNN